MLPVVLAVLSVLAVMLALARQTRRSAPGAAYTLTAAGCVRQLLYSLSTSELDGDSAYGSGTMFGNWGPSGACDGSETGMALLVAVRPAATAPLSSCADILARDRAATSGMYLLASPALGTTVPVYCDMATDFGGWDVVYSTAGDHSGGALIGGTPHVGDVADGDSLVLPGSHIAAIAGAAGASAQLLLWRGDDVWLKAECDGAVLDGALAGVGGSYERVRRCQLTASDGAAASGVVAWSSAGALSGGSFAVLLDGASTFDRSDVASQPLRNAACRGHLVFDTRVGDAVRYGASVSLGAWQATSSGCGSGSMSETFALRIGVRAGSMGSWQRVASSARLSAGGLPRTQVQAGGFDATALRITYRDGVFGCNGDAQDASWPWDACAGEYVGPEAGYGVHLWQNNARVLSAPTQRQLPEGCVVDASNPGAGAIACALDAPLHVSDGQVVSLEAFASADEGAWGSVSADVNAFVPHTCAPLAVVDGAEVACSHAGSWVRIVADAQHDGGVASSSVAVTLPSDGVYRVTQVKAVHKSGYITCNTSATTPSFGWGACFPGVTRPDGGVPVFFELMRNADAVITMPSRTEVATGCSPPPAGLEGTGAVVCQTDFTLSNADTVTPTWWDIRTGQDLSLDGGSLTLDLWAYVTPADAVAMAASTAAAAAAAASEPQWTLLASDVPYSGTGPNTMGAAPQLNGVGEVHVSKVRAVHRRGSVGCSDTADADDEHVWETCGGAFASAGAGGSRPLSFELKLNGEYVLEAPSWADPPSACTETPRSTGLPAGDFVCDVSFDLRHTDVLTPDTFEASHGVFNANNTGVHYVDIWGLVEPYQPVDVAPRAYVGEGDVCQVSCPPGLTLVGTSSLTCEADGSWSAAAPHCVGLSRGLHATVCTRVLLVCCCCCCVCWPRSVGAFRSGARPTRPSPVVIRRRRAVIHHP